MIDVFHKILIHIPALYQNLHYNHDHKLKTSETPLKSQVQGTRQRAPGFYSRVHKRAPLEQEIDGTCSFVRQMP